MTSAPRQHGKNAFMFVLVVVMIDMIGFSLIMPVMPQLIHELASQPLEEAVKWAGPLSATYALMNLLFGPVLGGLSDRFGRRPVLLASVATLGLDFLIMGFAQSLWLLFIGRALSGISGATFSTANAYIADVTPPERRGQAFGMIGAAFGLGFVIGPVIGGLLGELDTRAPFFAAALLSLLSFLYGVFVLPESLDKSKRRPFDYRRANPFGAFRHFSKLPEVYWLLLAAFLFHTAHYVFPATWSYHAEIRYGWSARDIGLSLGLVGLSAAMVQGGLTGRFIKKFGSVRTVWFGLTVTAAAMCAYAFAGKGWMALATIAPGALGGLTGAALQSLMSNRTPENAQGELQGANASLQSLSAIISPLVMTQMLSTFSTSDAPVRFPGAAFLLAGLLTVLAFLPFALGVRGCDRDGRREPRGATVRSDAGVG